MLIIFRDEIKLSIGITGFAPEYINPCCNVSLQEFLQIGWHLVRCFDFSRFVDESKKGDCSGNYHIGRLEDSKRTVYLLANQFYPILSFSSHSEVEFAFEDYLDMKAEIEQLPMRFKSEDVNDSVYNRYFVMTKKDLMIPLKTEMISKLHEHERSQFDYWRPYYLHDVIFNFWD